MLANYKKTSFSLQGALLGETSKAAFQPNFKF